MSIKHALLGLLHEKPRGVGSLQRDFEQSTQGVWPVNVGQIYQTIKRLERDGLVADTGEETDPETGRVVSLMAITDAGRREVEAWVKSPVVAAPARRDELEMKLAVAASTGWDLSEVIQTQRYHVIEELRGLSREAITTPQTLEPRRLHVERRIFELEAEARFLDHVEALFRNHAGGRDKPRGTTRGTKGVGDE